MWGRRGMKILLRPFSPDRGKTRDSTVFSLVRLTIRKPENVNSLFKNLLKLGKCYDIIVKDI